MSFRAGRWAILLGLPLLTVSCRALPESTPPGAAQVTSEGLPTTDAVPREWGDLVAVTQPTADVYLLWFQDEDGNVHSVGYDVAGGNLRLQALFIPRR